MVRELKGVILQILPFELKITKIKAPDFPYFSLTGNTPAIFPTSSAAPPASGKGVKWGILECPLYFGFYSISILSREKVSGFIVSKFRFKTVHSSLTLPP